MIQSEKNCFPQQQFALPPQRPLFHTNFLTDKQKRNSFLFCSFVFQINSLFSSFYKWRQFSKTHTGDKENVKPNKWRNFWTESTKPHFSADFKKKKGSKNFFASVCSSEKSGKTPHLNTIRTSEYLNNFKFTNTVFKHNELDCRKNHYIFHISCVKVCFFFALEYFFFFIL